MATRVRELLDENMPLITASPIVSLERRLQAGHQRIVYLEGFENPT